MIHFTFNSAQTKEYLKDLNKKDVVALISIEEPSDKERVKELSSSLNAATNRLFYIMYNTSRLSWKWDVLIIQSLPNLQREKMYLEDYIYTACKDSDLAEVVWLTDT